MSITVILYITQAPPEASGSAQREEHSNRPEFFMIMASAFSRSIIHGGRSAMTKAIGGHRIGLAQARRGIKTNPHVEVRGMDSICASELAVIQGRVELSIVHI